MGLHDFKCITGGEHPKTCDERRGNGQSLYAKPCTVLVWYKDDQGRLQNTRVWCVFPGYSRVEYAEQDPLMTISTGEVYYPQGVQTTELILAEHHQFFHSWRTDPQTPLAFEPMCHSCSVREEVDYGGKAKLPPLDRIVKVAQWCPLRGGVLGREPSPAAEAPAAAAEAPEAPEAPAPAAVSKNGGGDKRCGDEKKCGKRRRVL
jgi:hypothetical protein